MAAPRSRSPGTGWGASRRNGSVLPPAAVSSDGTVVAHILLMAFMPLDSVPEKDPAECPEVRLFPEDCMLLEGAACVG